MTEDGTVMDQIRSRSMFRALYVPVQLIHFKGTSLAKLIRLPKMNANTGK